MPKGKSEVGLACTPKNEKTSFLEKSIFRKMFHMARNFQTWLQDCVAAREDLELKIRLLSAVSIAFRGLEAQLQLMMKSVRRRMFQVEIFIGDFGR